MSKQEFLDQMRAGRAELDTATNGMSEEQITQEIVAGEWTVKDILAHLAAWQGEAQLAAERVAAGQPDGYLIEESIDDWNAHRVAERRRLPLVDVMQELNETYEAVLAALERCPEGAPPNCPDLWESVGNLWWLTWHASEHAGIIRAYRERIDAS
ncbi:MAG TPA: DinB family protein [Ktedonobacterales bacterium]|jgi:hypothetical protein